MKFIMNLIVVLCLSLIAFFLQAKSILHKIAAGDVLSVGVVGHGDLSMGKVSVATDGTVRFELLGKVKLSGLGLDEASDKVGQLYEKDYLKSANVIINLISAFEGNAEVDRSKINILFIGRVRNPGRLNLEKSIDLLSAISAAGGLAQGAKKDSILVRGKGEKDSKRYDYTLLVDGKIESPVMQDGDIIKVLGGAAINADLSKIRVLFLGKVKKPGAYPLNEKTDLLTGITEAGGLDKGAVKEVSIRRKGIKKEIIVDYDDMVEGSVGSPELKNGDIVNVGESFW